MSERALTFDFNYDFSIQKIMTFLFKTTLRKDYFHL
jgi:hypothetical protein